MSSMSNKNFLVLFRDQFGSGGADMKDRKFIDELCTIIGLLWERKEVYRERLKREELEEIQCELLTSTFRFSAMFRSFIPKANKPGMFRPITQPAERDRIVMEG